MVRQVEARRSRAAAEEVRPPQCMGCTGRPHGGRATEARRSHEAAVRGRGGERCSTPARRLMADDKMARASATPRLHTTAGGHGCGLRGGPSAGPPAGCNCCSWAGRTHADAWVPQLCARAKARREEATHGGRELQTLRYLYSQRLS